MAKFCTKIHTGELFRIAVGWQRVCTMCPRWITEIIGGDMCMYVPLHDDCCDGERRCRSAESRWEKCSSSSSGSSSSSSSRTSSSEEGIASGVGRKKGNRPTPCLLRSKGLNTRTARWMALTTSVLVGLALLAENGGASAQQTTGNLTGEEFRERRSTPRLTSIYRERVDAKWRQRRNREIQATSLRESGSTPNESSRDA